MNIINIDLPLTNDQFRNKIPQFWVGEELAVLSDYEMIESEVNNYWRYDLKAKIATKDNPPYKIFATDMFRPQTRVNVTEYMAQ